MLALRPRTVADLYDELMQLLAALGIHAAINTMPNEMPDPCPFPDDGRHSSYDAEAAHRFWRGLLQVDRVLKLFRSGFLCKFRPEIGRTSCRERVGQSVCISGV